jgi:hypothetical protein
MAQAIPDPADLRSTMAANIANVLETTRRAWLATTEDPSFDMAPARHAGFPRRPMQASVLVAVNFWSHKTL